MDLGFARFREMLRRRAAKVVLAIIGLTVAFWGLGEVVDKSTLVSALSGVLSLFGTFLAAAIGWVTLEFLGRPFRKFFDLRGEVIRLSVETANIPARFKEPRSANDSPEVFELSDEDTKRLEEAVRALRNLAAQMTAFAENETIALRIAYLFGYNAKAASQALIGISNTRHLYGPSRKYHIDGLKRALKLDRNQVM